MFARRTRVITFLFGAASLFAQPVQVDAQCTAPSFDAAINVQGAGPGPAGEITAGDVNGDGITDLLVPRFIANTVSVILGNAAGPPTVVLVTSVIRPLAVGVGDFNADGKADLVVSHEPSPPLLNVSLAVLLGDGSGGFGPPTDFPASLSRPLVVADFNNDGKQDVFLGNSSTNVSKVHLGNGSGGLGAGINLVIPNNNDAVVADFNSDGKMDLATADESSAFVAVVLGDGTGQFGSATSFPVGSARSIAAADFNGDGKLDLLTAGQSNGISLLLGNGLGAFAGTIILPTGFATVAVAVGDFNADGKADVTAVGASLVAILLGDGTGGVAGSANYATSQAPVNVVTGDLNGDNKLDVAVANCNGCGDAASIFRGDGNGKLRLPLLLPAGPSPFSIANGDLNNDGKPDLVVANIGHNTVTVSLANGVGSFAPPVSFAVGTQPRSVNLGDLNGDQKLDLVTANFDAGTVSVLLGEGLGGFGSPSHIPVPGSSPQYASIADFNNDAFPDLVVAYLNASFVSILLGNGTGGFGSPTNFPVPSGAQQVVVNDFNRDGRADLAVASISGVSILLRNAAGGFAAANTLTTPATAFSVVASDFNSDGKADLAAAIPNINAVLVYLGDGFGGFGPQTTFPTGSSPSWIVAADYNGDSNSDLATANSLGTASVLLGNGAGGFGPAVTFAHGGSITRSLTSADLNADGRPDLALANQVGSVSVIFNACSATTFSIPLLSISDTVLTEGDSGTVEATFTVSLSVASSKMIDVSVYTAPRDAKKDLDYQDTLGRVPFPPGTTSQIITVPVIGETLDEFDELFSVVLAHPLNAGIGKGQGLGTILDNDPPPTVSISDAAVIEGDTGTSSATFTLTLSRESGKPISLQYETVDGTTSGADYVSQSGTVTIPAGSLSASINIQINGDTTPESDETFVVNLSNPVNVTIARQQGTGTILNDDQVIQFSSSTYAVSETGPRVDLTVTRNGDTTLGASVRIATNDAAGLTNCNVSTPFASPRCDFINAIGTISFAAGETTRNFSVAIIDDSYGESNEIFTVGLSSPLGATLGVRSTTTVTITDNEAMHGPNPIDNTEFFVRQQYLDFLGREPDPPGFAGWVNTINNCSGDTTQCDRIHVSQLFFQSAEFQERGYFVYRFYPVSFGRKPDYDEFVPALASVSGFLDNNQLEAAKVAFIATFMAQPAFANTYNPLNNTQYVDMLLTTAGVTLATRQALIDGLNNATLTRAQVLRHIVESTEVSTKYNHQAYAVMEYFGYLRRQPDAFYLDWIAVLDQTNDPRGMVTGFVNSLEYRQRFGP